MRELKAMIQNEGVENEYIKGNDRGERNSEEERCSSAIIDNDKK